MTTQNLSTPVCNSCGACCRHFPFVKVSQHDIDTLESFTGLAPEEFSNIDELESDKLFMKFNEKGDCVFLKTVDGRYACGVYEARPNICRVYPANEAQNMTCRVISNQVTAIEELGTKAI